MGHKEVTPQDLVAAADVVRDAANQADQIGFEQAVAQRRELLVLLARVREALSFTEAEILRQVERTPKVSGGQTFVAGADKTVTTNHELVLDRMYKKAMLEAMDPTDGHVDWGVLGQKVGELVQALYLSPSVQAKRGGLGLVGLDARAVETETVRGRKLIVHGDPG